MEDDGRLIGVLEKNLLRNIDDDGDGEEDEQRDTDLRAGAQLLEVVDKLARHFIDETHGDRRCVDVYQG